MNLEQSTHQKAIQSAHRYAASASCAIVARGTPVVDLFDYLIRQGAAAPHIHIDPITGVDTVSGFCLLVPKGGDMQSVETIITELRRKKNQILADEGTPFFIQKEEIYREEFEAYPGLSDLVRACQLESVLDEDGSVVTAKTHEVIVPSKDAVGGYVGRAIKKGTHFDEVTKKWTKEEKPDPYGTGRSFPYYQIASHAPTPPRLLRPRPIEDEERQP